MWSAGPGGLQDPCSQNCLPSRVLFIINKTLLPFSLWTLAKAVVAASRQRHHTVLVTERLTASLKNAFDDAVKCASLIKLQRFLIF